ncbi:hypothetical protein ABW636_05865 [Aquimarina sp. 2201CG1-2-11]|uniref:hypothetical protein n=1 Tax=Aquimarina discodermiae TaxID=3231043 RepID=UPI003462A603
MFAQNSILVRKELYGRWGVERDINDPSKLYLINSGFSRAIIEKGVEFFIGEFTDKKKIKFFSLISPQKKQRHRCGNDHSRKHNRGSSKKEAVWYYNENTGILTILDSKFLGGTLFMVEKINSFELVLTKIEKDF